AAFYLHRRPGKHAALSGGEDVSDPHGGTKYTRAIQHARSGELAQPRRQIIFTQAGVAEIDRKREIRTSGMINGNERTVRDAVQRLLTSITGMRAPTYVCQ